MLDIINGNGDSYAINDNIVNTYNLFDDTLLDHIISGYVYLKNGIYFSCVSGTILLCNRWKHTFQFYDSEYKLISTVANTIYYKPTLVPENAMWFRMYFDAANTAIGSNVLVYASENDISPTDDRREYVPNRLMSGNTVDSSIYDTTYPESPNSEFMNRVKYEIIREERKAQNKFRIGTFNTFISRQAERWSDIRRMTKDLLIDICAFQEVHYGSGSVVERRLPEYLKSWLYPYGSYHTPINEGETTNAVSNNKAIASHWEVLSTYYHVFRCHPGQQFIKCVILLPEYKFYPFAARRCTLSLYSYHGCSTNYNGTSASDIRIQEIEEMMETISQDTSDFIVICGDTNSFESTTDKTTGKHAEWEKWKSYGFKPVTDGSCPTIGFEYGVSNGFYNADGEWISGGSYDQIFVGDNIKADYWSVVPPRHYANSGDVPISDHNLLYADLIFDFDKIVKERISKIKGFYDTQYDVAQVITASEESVTVEVGKAVTVEVSVNVGCIYGYTHNPSVADSVLDSNGVIGASTTITIKGMATGTTNLTIVGNANAKTVTLDIPVTVV